MCGRYTLNKQTDDIAKRFNIAQAPTGLRPNFNVAPGQTMPVIVENGSGVRKMELMHWGIARHLGPDIVKELINTRADKAFSGFWRKTVQTRRCLIPATSFFEWQKKGSLKRPFLIHPKQLDLFALAGIWDAWENNHGQKMNAYSIMTTEANKEMKTIHERMPVILHPEDETAWLNTANDSSEGLEKLLFPYENGSLEMYEVSQRVNSPKENDAALLRSV